MIRNFVISLGAILAIPAAAFGLEVQAVESPGGFKAWLVEDHTIPFTALEIDFGGGAVLEGPNIDGAAYFLAGMFEEGAGGYDAAEFQRRVQELAVDFSFDAYQEVMSVSVKFLTENKEESIELLRLALEEPRYDSDRLEFVRSQILAIIANREKDATDIAYNRLNREVFGSHPLGEPIEGTVESIEAMTAEDLETFRQKALNRSDIIVGAAGDITAEELGLVLDQLFAGLASEAPALPAEPQSLLDAGTTVIDYPAPQSFVVFRHAGVERDDPEFLTAYVMNEILGSQSYLSRLKDEVREKRGLTYGIASYLSTYDEIGFISGQFSTDNRSVGEALEVVEEVWFEMAENGVTEEELQNVKTYLTGAYPLRFDGNSRIASILAAMQRQGRAITYFDDRNDMVNALTVEDINRMAKRLLKSDELHFVIVGQPEGLESRDVATTE